jgi:hypothetical protein
MRIALSAAAVAALLATLPPARANLISNGSYEVASADSSLPTGNGTELGDGSTAIAGWTVTGSNTLTWLPNSNGFNVSTPYGSYFLDLTGASDRTPFAGVEQTIATTPGATYALSFALGVNQSVSYDAGPVTVSASAGLTSGLFTVNPAGSGNIWTMETQDFTAAADTTLISIVGSVGADYIGLDDVSVDLIQAVPEPTALALFAAALAGLCCIRRSHAL